MLSKMKTETILALGIFIPLLTLVILSIRMLLQTL